MSYRFMRMLVMFDLPTETTDQKREYRRFRKVLIQNGFSMLQESVYTRLILTPSVEIVTLSALKKEKPKGGIVTALMVTEKQFSGMEYIVGEYHSETLDTDERVVVF